MLSHLFLALIVMQALSSAPLYRWPNWGQGHPPRSHMEGAAAFRAGALKSHLSYCVFLRLRRLKGFRVSQRVLGS